jgi:hypothetical protein
MNVLDASEMVCQATLFEATQRQCDSWAVQGCQLRELGDTDDEAALKEAEEAEVAAEEAHATFTRGDNATTPPPSRPLGRWELWNSALSVLSPARCLLRKRLVRDA